MPETYGTYASHETLITHGPWSVARANDALGQPVRLSTLTLPAGLSAGDKARVAGALERGIKARAAAPPMPGSLAVLGGGEQDGVLYLAESAPNGPSLRELVGKTGPMPGDRAVTFLHGLAGSLDPLHASGLAHGWLTPDNVYAENAAPVVGSQLWSSVLGMLRELAPASPWPEPEYAAPETLAGVTADAHGEVYSAAALLLFAATGHDASAGPAVLGLLTPALAAAITKGMSQEPDARYNGVKEMIVDVTVEQAIAMTDAAEHTAIPDGGSVPDWAKDLLAQTDLRRASGQTLVEGAAPPAPPAPMEPAKTPPPPAPTPMMPEPPARHVHVAPSAPAAPPAPPAGVPVFDWSKGQTSAKKSPLPTVAMVMTVAFVVLGIAVTLLRHHH